MLSKTAAIKLSAVLLAFCCASACRKEPAADKTAREGSADSLQAPVDPPPGQAPEAGTETEVPGQILEADYSSRLWKSGTRTRVFAEKAAVRSGPSPEDPVIAGFPFGAEVTITGKAANGWWKVTADGASPASGTGAHSDKRHVFGDDLAKMILKADLNGDGKPEKILVGLRAKPKDAEAGYIVVRILGEGGMLAEAMPADDLLRYHDYDLSARYLGIRPGFPDLRWLTVDAGLGACEYSQPVYLFAWDGKKLHAGPDSQQGSRYIFPGDPGGTRDAIIIKEPRGSEEGESGERTFTWLWDTEGGWLKFQEEDFKNDGKGIEGFTGVDAKNCDEGYCTWYDAYAYCMKRGGLLTVDQLQNLYRAECTGGRKSDDCSKMYWSSDAADDAAWYVSFSGGDAGYAGKRQEHFFPKCLK